MLLRLFSLPYSKGFLTQRFGNSTCLLSWILINGKVNAANILQKKLPDLVLSPSRCVSCAASGECQQHLFFQCLFALACWEFLINFLYLVFYSSVPSNIFQLLCGPVFSPKVKLLWVNSIKALSSELW